MATPHVTQRSVVLVHRLENTLLRIIYRVFLACTVRKSNNLRIINPSVIKFCTHVSGHTKMLLILSFISVQIWALTAFPKDLFFAFSLHLTMVV